MTNRLVFLSILTASLCRKGKTADPRAEWPVGKKTTLELKKALSIAQKIVGTDYYCIDAHLYTSFGTKKQGESEFTPHPIWTIRFDSKMKLRKDVWVFENSTTQVYDYGKSGMINF